MREISELRSQQSSCIARLAAVIFLQKAFNHYYFFFFPIRLKVPYEAEWTKHKGRFYTSALCFPGPFLVSTLALWNFQSFIVSLSLVGWCWRSQILQKRTKKQKQKQRHLFLVALLPCALAASPAVSFPPLCSQLLRGSSFFFFFFTLRTPTLICLLKVSAGLRWTFKSLLTVTDLIPSEGAGYAAALLQCWEVQRSST